MVRVPVILDSGPGDASSNAVTRPRTRSCRPTVRLVRVPDDLLRDQVNGALVIVSKRQRRPKDTRETTPGTGSDEAIHCGRCVLRNAN